MKEWIEDRQLNMASEATFSDMSAVALEAFVYQSSAKTRVITSIKWLCNNLHLRWPLEDIEQPKVGRGSGTIGMEARQTPAAQPMMFVHLEDMMKRKCEEEDPVWMALLASWLQAAANLRLAHIIRRSVPVERFDGWFLFFCKRGKQKHNRQGFYWGVMDVTSDGWDWATPFLNAYKMKRASNTGHEMMGAIFRTDDMKYFTPRAVNIITQAVMQEVVENPQLLGTYSWRRYPMTMALQLKCSPEERLALGDWQDKELIRTNAPITLRYAE